MPKGMKPPLAGDSTQARLQRAHDRGLDRRGRVISVPRKQQFAARMEGEQQEFTKSRKTRTTTTPFGPVTLSKFPTRDKGPKITTKKGDYEGQSVGHKYRELTPQLFPPVQSAKKSLRQKRQRESDSEIANELLTAIETDLRPPRKKRKIGGAAQRNAAAKMLAISHVSEPLRMPGSGKAFRGALRAIKAKTLSPHDAFASDTPAFGMALTPNFQRRLVNRKLTQFRKPPTEPEGFPDLSGYLSDSSDEKY